MSNPVLIRNPRGDEVYKDSEGHIYHIHYRKDLYNSYRCSYHKNGCKARFHANKDGTFEILLLPFIKESKHCHESSKLEENSISNKKRTNKEIRKRNKEAAIASQDAAYKAKKNVDCKKEESKDRKVSFEGKVSTRSQTTRKRGASENRFVCKNETDEESTFDSVSQSPVSKARIKPRIKNNKDETKQKIKNFILEIILRIYI